MQKLTWYFIGVYIIIIDMCFSLNSAESFIACTGFLFSSSAKFFFHMKFMELFYFIAKNKKMGNCIFGILIIPAHVLNLLPRKSKIKGQFK